MIEEQDPREVEHHPRKRTVLIGHEDAESRLLGAYQRGKIHHAWLIAGRRGIGKATLAYRFARFAFQNPNLGTARSARSLYVPAESPIAHRVASRGHADLLVLEREFDLKKQRLKTEIVVEGAREVSEFFSMTAGEGGWRICIVDLVDDLNEQSANALLKVLEEPPQRSLFLLVSHQPGALLATIRSRCVRLDLIPLSESQTATVLEQVTTEMPRAALAQAAAQSRGSPGRAIELLGRKGAESFAAFLACVGARGALDFGEQIHLAESFFGKDGAEDFEVFCDLLLDWTAAQARAQPVRPQGIALAEAHQEIAHSIRMTNALNLDRRQALLDAFSRLEDAMKAA